MSTTRRLAAILAADVVGYSRLMGADEVGTLQALKAHRREVVDPAITTHNGRIVKTTGDGMLVEFASAVDAVNCAMAVQKSMADRNATNANGSPRIVFRIGINVGDIIIEDDDIFGDGVNVAARMEAECEPGGVYLSANAFEQIRSKTPFKFDDMGERQLKNIDRPVRVYSAREGEPKVKTPNGLQDVGKPLQLPDKPSIAVLPFQNMSGDPEQEYFADGMVEDIITALSRFKSLFVIARNSSFTYKGKAIDIKQVGQELGVRYVLEGSVRKGGNRLRITSQLIDATTGGHLWADHFDGRPEDIFDLQDQITTSVIGQIAPTVEQAEIERSKLKPTESLAAYDYFLRGMASFYGSTKKANDHALHQYYKAIELDPDFLAAHGWAAIAYGRRKQGFWITEPEREIPEGVRLARRAIALATNDAFSLNAGGFTLAYLAGELDAGIALTDRALQLNPNLAVAWQASGWIRSYIGEPNTAIEHLARAMRLSPLDPQMGQLSIAMALALRCAGRYDEAAFWANKVLQEEPDFLAALVSYSVSTALAGRLSEAKTAMSRLLQIDPSLNLSRFEANLLFRRPEDRLNAVKGARVAGMPE